MAADIVRVAVDSLVLPIVLPRVAATTNSQTTTSEATTITPADLQDTEQLFTADLPSRMIAPCGNGVVKSGMSVSFMGIEYRVCW